MLISLFINKLTNYIRQEGMHGIQLSSDWIQLIILFAGDTVVGLQNHVLC